MGIPSPYADKEIIDIDREIEVEAGTSLVSINTVSIEEDLVRRSAIDLPVHVVMEEEEEEDVLEEEHYEEGMFADLPIP